MKQIRGVDYVFDERWFKPNRRPGRADAGFSYSIRVWGVTNVRTEIRVGESDAIPKITRDGLMSLTQTVCHTSETVDETTRQAECEGF